MMMPTIQKVSRKREFNSYDDHLKSEVIKGWLCDGLTHRELDEDILGLSRKVSKGFQSMGILHFLGLKKEFSGIFRDVSLQYAVDIMSKDEQDFGQIIELLLYKQEAKNKTLKTLKDQEASELSISQNSSSQERKARIKKASKKPSRQSVISYTYKRNPDIVAETLFRANGNCESCGNHGPFNRASDGSVYLEVHHIVPLSQDGEDSLSNVHALCPNCHRKAHFG
jgi:5-methylcytosine-specific restriction protein A